MKIALVSSEIYPYSKTGGLADVAGALGKQLANDGQEVRLFTPLYDVTKGEADLFHRVEYLQNLRMDLGGREISYSVWTSQLPDSEGTVYFIDAPEFYSRGTIYTDDQDEPLRFALLSRGAIECCQQMGWSPDILHCNDWQSALIPLYLRTIYRWDGLFEETKTVLTIHNLAYQGAFRAGVVEEIGFNPDEPLLHKEDLQNGLFNYLKHGIMYADLITTVSQTYAKEITTPEFGEGLDRLLRERGEGVVGIVNGVDYEEWNPQHDRLIPATYDRDNLEGKMENRRVLLERLDLPPADPDVPVFGIVSRLVAQKGFDLFYDILDSFLRYVDMRLVILGTGSPTYEEYFQGVQNRHPHKVCFYRGYSDELAHLIEAGIDIFLMPSRYEPCGLNQIYSLKYGTVPIVRKTGGLADTVIPYNLETREGNGFVFDHYTSQGLGWGIQEALNVWNRGRKEWEGLMRQGMDANWSWERQVDRYLEVYRSLLGEETDVKKESTDG